MLADKRTTLSSALDQPGEIGSVMVMLVTDYPGVNLSPALLERATEGTIWLRYSHRFGTHLNLREDGIEADLSSSGTLYPTFVPWGAVVVLTEESTGTQVYWPLKEPVEQTRPVPARNHLRLVPLEDSEPS